MNANPHTSIIITPQTTSPFILLLPLHRVDMVLRTKFQFSTALLFHSVLYKTLFFPVQSCSFLNGAQCCQLYLWIAQIPIIGTPIKLKLIIPRRIGLFNIDAAKCPIGIWSIYLHYLNSPMVPDHFQMPIDSKNLSLFQLHYKHHTFVRTMTLRNGIFV